jgi:hypothetical protein
MEGSLSATAGPAATDSLKGEASKIADAPSIFKIPLREAFHAAY